ncbi:hypothetical protein VF13_41195 [Nostoc linckia z16]|nr:hypothetical protein VF13_41195 [Nostoc linckia z16]
MKIIPQAVAQEYVCYAMAMLAEAFNFIIGQPVPQRYNQVVVLQLSYRMSRTLIRQLKHGIGIRVDRSQFSLYEFAAIDPCFIFSKGTARTFILQ